MNNYYDKDTLQEYHRLHSQVVSNMPRYMRGELKGNELTNFKKLSKELDETQKELDRQYMSKKHANDSKFWDDWARIHN